ncbi:hypothetical protein [Prochlorothrix hollandica]|uniref:Effector-associated domain-containing protein n=1 Tax=Prochlorothrix hollandica PCC 9006 = CALU 1027 TaxID=317619 RepID=A0A0M2PT89_PROHO|nr:hypothetical protein [Prochlorothrix hollandica]KKI98357.1 hypothetical protein PROH_19590 [Prochlorothrix hollandica PCC 9006 = CALU 1027]
MAEGRATDRATGRATGDENVRLLQEQLAGKEKALILAPLEDKVRIRQQISELRREIAEVEDRLSAGETGRWREPGAAAVQSISEGQGFQANQPTGPVIQGNGNQVSVNYYGGEAGQQPTGQPPTGSRVQQLRRDRLERELDHLTQEYQAVADQVAVTLDPTVRVRLERQLEQLEARMGAIEADLTP